MKFILPNCSWLKVLHFLSSSDITICHGMSSSVRHLQHSTAKSTGQFRLRCFIFLVVKAEFTLISFLFPDLSLCCAVPCGGTLQMLQVLVQSVSVLQCRTEIAAFCSCLSVCVPSSTQVYTLAPITCKERAAPLPFILGLHLPSNFLLQLYMEITLQRLHNHWQT